MRDAASDLWDMVACSVFLSFLTGLKSFAEFKQTSKRGEGRISSLYCIHRAIEDGSSFRSFSAQFSERIAMNSSSDPQS